jgi:flagellar protein FliS
MSLTNSRNGIEQYQKTGVQGSIETATPHRLIQMLMEGALSKVASARGFMARGDIAKKGEHISWAMSIIDGLRLSLDKSVGGDIAQNLDDLYDYINRRLLQANLHNKPEYLDEITALLTEIKSGWDAISQDIITDHSQQKEQQSDLTRVSNSG